jgi:hypothetical protein
MTEQPSKPISLDDILIAPSVRDAWNARARQAAVRMAQSGKAPAQVTDEQAEIYADGSLLVFASAGDERIEMRVAPDEWAYAETEKPFPVASAKGETMNPNEPNAAPDWRLVAEVYEREHPALWRKCYPRVYQSIGGFESPRFVAISLAAAIQWIEVDRASAPLSCVHLACVASRAFDYNLPALFVGKEFFGAICQTDLPADTRWTEAQLPYEAGLLYLPLGAMRDPEGASVNVLAWWRARKGEQVMVGERTQINCKADQLTVVAICEPSSQRMYSRAVDSTQTPYIIAPTIEAGARGVWDLPITSDDETFLSRMVSVCFSLLIAQTARPELLTPEHRATGKRTKKAPREIWTPNFLGKGYTARRETAEGTHASPRLHWRRGHFRNQAYGPKHSERKTIWIEPTLIGSDE